MAEGAAGRTGAGRRDIGYGREGEDEYQLYGKFTMIKDAPVLQFTRRQAEDLTRNYRR